MLMLWQVGVLARNPGVVSALSGADSLTLSDPTVSGSSQTGLISSCVPRLSGLRVPPRLRSMILTCTFKLFKSFPPLSRRGVGIISHCFASLLSIIEASCRCALLSRRSFVLCLSGVGSSCQTRTGFRCFLVLGDRCRISHL